MKGFDRRHRWGEPLRVGPARYERTCRVCGKVYGYEVVLPDSIVASIVEQVAKPNPYRTLLGLR